MAISPPIGSVALVSTSTAVSYAELRPRAHSRIVQWKESGRISHQTQNDGGVFPSCCYAASSFHGPYGLQPCGRATVLHVIGFGKEVWCQQLQLQRPVYEPVNEAIQLGLLQHETRSRLLTNRQSGCRPLPKLSHRSEVWQRLEDSEHTLISSQSSASNAPSSSVLEQHVCSSAQW